MSVALRGNGDDFWLSFGIHSKDAEPVPNVFNEVVFHAVTVLVLVAPLILFRVKSGEYHKVTRLVGEEIVHVM